VLRGWSPILILGVLVALDGCADRDPTMAGEFPFLSDTPYPAQHVNPRNADFVDRLPPEDVLPIWTALDDSTVPQPCVSGGSGRIYCVRAWDRASDRCNLIALDLASGAVEWEDRVDGRCQLDEYAWITNPLVDVAGNLYVADSQQILSFSGDGRLVAAPFDIPSEKVASGPTPPPGFMAGLASPTAAAVLFDGAPAPNPSNDGAPWAIRLDRNAPGGPALAVQFLVRFAGPGGVATTPTLTADGGFVLVGHNEGHLIAVDVPACLSLPSGSECDAFARAEIGEKLGASVTVTPEDRVLVAAPRTGVLAFDVGRSAGRPTLAPVYRQSFGQRIVSGVLTGFPTLTYFPLTDSTSGEHFLTAIETATGRPRSAAPAGDFASVTMGDDGATLLTNNINFVDELAGRHHAAGVTAWRAVAPIARAGRSAARQTAPPR
jgi:hypothetical protein